MKSGASQCHLVKDYVDLGHTRRQLLWDLAEAYRLARRPKSQLELPLCVPEEQASLPPQNSAERLATMFASTGVSLEAHLTSLRWDVFTRAGARSIGELPRLRHGQKVRVGGLIVSRQRPPTARGVCFLALEVPDGLVNVIVPPDVYAECQPATRRPFVILEGVVEHAHGAINVVALSIRAV